MSIISNLYQKNFLMRYDKDGAIPYLCASDFPDLVCLEDVFVNEAHVRIRYFNYFYEGYDGTKLLLFCHGLGPGHTAYLAEIETLCRAGYRVLTLDYTGCGASGGERLPSINTPTQDVTELLNLLRPQEEIIPIGHSMGGYTALNVTHLLPSVTRAVILSGFVDIADAIMGFVKLRPFANAVKRFEKKLNPRYGTIDNLTYLATTTDKLLWIHSTDDPMVSYRYSAAKVQKIGNSNVRVITATNKKHNPQYTVEALERMNAWMGEYYRLVGAKKLDTLEARKAYFADKSAAQMTEQDPAVYAEILRFIR